MFNEIGEAKFEEAENMVAKLYVPMVGMIAGLIDVVSGAEKRPRNRSKQNGNDHDRTRIY